MRSYLAHLVIRGIRAVPHTAAPGKVLYTLAAVLALGTPPGACATSAAAALLAEGQRLAEAGACGEALARVDELLALEPAPTLAAEAWWLQGGCLERLDDLHGAIEAYDRLLAQVPPSDRAADALFRRGVDHLLAGAPRTALPDLRRARRAARRAGEVEQARAALQLAACHEALGHPDRATRGAVPALEVFDAHANDPQLTWYRAQAHVVLGALLVRGAEDLSLATPCQQTQKDRLARRWELLQQAEGHFRAAGELGAPLWTCAAGVRLGLAYERFRDAVLQAPPPRSLDVEQAAVYAAGLETMTARFVNNAAAIYRDVLTFAAAARVQNSWTEIARARLAEIEHSPLLD